MNKSQEEMLLQQLKEGAEPAFKKVYLSNKEKFLGFGSKYGLPEEELLDIYQETYITFYENILEGKLIHLSCTISTYIISIGKYKILDKLRKNKKTVPSESILSKVITIDDPIASFELESEKLSPKEELLKQHLKQLGAKCKAILEMFYYKKHTIKEIMIAGNYNSENVVKSQKSRCLKTLKRLFNQAPIS